MAVKQTIPTYTNSTKSLTLGNFKGIDASSSPFEVNISRATYCQNLINEDGVNHKRQGWTQDIELNNYIFSKKNTEILGIYPVVLGYESENVYGYVIAYKTATDIAQIEVKLKNDYPNINSTNNITLSINSNTKNVGCFTNAGKVYVLCGGNYILITLEKENEIFSLKFKEQKEFAYIPTTTISINSVYDEENNRATLSSLEEANVLTPKRKNSLIGMDRTPIEFVFYYSYSMASGTTTVSYIDVYKTSESIDKAIRFYPKENDMTRIIGSVSEEGNYTIVMYFSSGGSQTKTVDIYRNIGGYSNTSTTTSSYGSDGLFLSENQNYKDVYFSEIDYKRSFSNRRYRLDSKAKINSEIKVKIISRYSKLIGEEYSCELTSESGYDVVHPAGYDDKFYKSSGYGVNVYEYEFSAIIESLEYATAIYNEEKKVVALYHDGEITFFVNTEVCMSGEDNIIVEFESENDNYTSLIPNCSFGIEYSDRLILSGSPNYPANVYFSHYNNFSYFPYINYNVIGSISNEIVALSILNDSTVAVYKSNKVNESTIYYIKPTTVDFEDVQKLAFSVTMGTIGETPVNHAVCCNLIGDNLILSDNGVYGISVKENISTDDRYAFERSGFINTLLKQHEDLSSAKAIVYKNRYYLAIDDVVYVADARLKSSARTGDMKDTFNYEWFYWVNVPVKQWLTIDGELYFLSTDNALNKFYNGFDDVKKIQLNTGAITTVSNDSYSLQFSELHEDLLKEGNEIILNGTNYLISDIDDYRTRFKLKDEDGNYIDTRTLDLNQSFFVLDKEPVVSVWKTPILSLGTTLYLKNLLSCTLIFEPNIEGNAKFGYSCTNKYRDFYSSISPSTGFDLDNLDFSDFSFEDIVAKSRTLKTRVRNFCFIEFIVESNDNMDCALNNFTILYNIGRKNKGVR
jgi:hypothetical protein